jgi:putative peptidoglycan lipid II flippase
VAIAFAAFVLNVIFSLLLMGPLKHGGLALASSLSALGNMGLLLWFLRRKIGPFGGREIVVSGFKAFLAALPMAFAVRWGMGLTDWSVTGEKIVKAGVLLGSIGFGVAVFMTVAHMLRCDEAREVVSQVRRRLGL